jgi:hypothetical protein
MDDFSLDKVRNALTTVCLAGPHQTPLREETLLSMDNYLVSRNC